MLAGALAMVVGMVSPAVAWPHDPQGNAFGWGNNHASSEVVETTTTTTVVDGNGAKANMNLGGKDFLIQENWNNGGNCDVERLIVSISGPNSMNCTDTYTWFATALGLGSSFTYVWKEGTQTGLGGGSFWYQVGTGPSYTRQGCPSDPYLWLKVEASDNFGGHGLAYKTVSIY